MSYTETIYLLALIGRHALTHCKGSICMTIAARALCGDAAAQRRYEETI